MAKFFITVRSPSGTTFGDALGATRYLSVPDGEAPAPKHEITLRPWLAAVMATLHKQGDTITGNILFFVHGFNVGISDVDDEHQKVAKGLAANLQCTVISFDWPSWAETFAYLEELDVAKRTAILLVNAGVKPLLLSETKECRVGIHALCHSMGAYVLREALDHADDGIKTGSDWMLNQLVMIAGDVEASDFVAGNKDTESMLGHSYRLTNYFNKCDAVLQISNVKRAGVEPRAGRVGLPPNAPAKTVNIDCTDHFKTLKAPADAAASISFSHSWWFDDKVFYADLAATLAGTVDRTAVPGRIVATDGGLSLEA
ncbi:alpha/beta hydrolase [Beijerinckia sp. L45]|uniref:alpha/beta hydrolase n=1 Tax=Beijerinckia sp. L45 TaxID=1641855 RepID=UPI00131B532A|nr:alpha/beta hydrolase [Beijerinckia sp. L45]